MRGHSRSTSDSPIPSPWYTHKCICDMCQLPRSHGNHRACSKKRQALYAQRAKEL